MMLLFLQLAPAEDAIAPSEPRESFQWKPALTQALYFLAIQHSFRFATEPGTRSGLDGPFLKGYFQAVGNLHGWSDGDPFYVNYIGHPMMGSVTGYIEAQNDPKYLRARFGTAHAYWVSRLRAFAFMAVYSEQFEIGPVSEASLGNVQCVPKARGIVDHVITPTAGLVWMVGEDAIDRFVVARIERSNHRPATIAVLRGMLNPSRSFANVLRFKWPWYRDNRDGVTPPRP